MNGERFRLPLTSLEEDGSEERPEYTGSWSWEILTCVPSLILTFAAHHLMPVFALQLFLQNAGSPRLPGWMYGRVPKSESSAPEVVTARERIHSGEREEENPQVLVVHMSRIDASIDLLIVPKGHWCVVVHRRSLPDETARIARSARAEGRHTEKELDAGDGDLTETW